MAIRVKDFSTRRENLTNELEFDSLTVLRRQRIELQRIEEELLGRLPPEAMLIECDDDGVITAGDREIKKLTPAWRQMLQLLVSGRCPRDRMKEEVIGVQKMMTMKDPDGAMKNQVSKLNKILGGYGLYLETDSSFYHLKKF